MPRYYLGLGSASYVPVGGNTIRVSAPDSTPSARVVAPPSTAPVLMSTFNYVGQAATPPTSGGFSAGMMVGAKQSGLVNNPLAVPTANQGGGGGGGQVPAEAPLVFGSSNTLPIVGGLAALALLLLRR